MLKRMVMMVLFVVGVASSIGSLHAGGWHTSLTDILGGIGYEFALEVADRELAAIQDAYDKWQLDQRNSAVKTQHHCVLNVGLDVDIEKVKRLRTDIAQALNADDEEQQMSVLNKVRAQIKDWERNEVYKNLKVQRPRVGLEGATAVGFIAVMTILANASYHYWPQLIATLM